MWVTDTTPHYGRSGRYDLSEEEYAIEVEAMVDLTTTDVLADQA
jgi:hypothetical protein